MCFAELPRPDRLKVLAEQAVARKKTELQVSMLLLATLGFAPCSILLIAAFTVCTIKHPLACSLYKLR